MNGFVREFLQDGGGQDLVEYTLLLAFVCMASAAIFIGTSAPVNSIWRTANGVISNANSASS